MPEATIVLGMHRSGTSALTRVLNLVGCDVSSDLRPPVPDNNETGFWEPFDVSLIHEEMLTSAGSSWDDVSELPASWYDSDVARPFQRRILEILRRDFGDSSLFVLKDPRICRLVPFWLRLLEELGASPSFVLSIRNPLEVARSLYARDRFSPAKSILLWLRHVLASERDSRGYRRSFVSYDALMTDWHRTVEKISVDLGIRYPKLSHQAAAEIEMFLSADLQHQHASTHDLVERSDVVEWVTRTYELVLQALESDSEELSKGFDEIREEVDRADMAYGPIMAHDRLLLKETELEVGALESEVAQKSRQLDEGAHQMQELENRTAQTTARQSEEITRLTREEEIREQRLHDVEGELESELKRLAEKEGRLSSEIGELSTALADGKAREDRLRKDVLRQQGRGQRIAQQISDREQRIAQLEKELVRATEVLMELREAVAHRDGEIARQSSEIAGQRAELERMRTALVLGGHRRKRVTAGRGTPTERPSVRHPNALKASGAE